MQKHKILHVIERFNVAGAEVVIKDLLCLFEDSIYEFHVCVLHDKGIIGTEMSERGFPVHHIDWSQDGLKDSDVIKRMRKLIEDIQPEIIHAHNITPWLFTTWATLGNKKINRCVTLHGFLVGNGAWKKKILYALLSRATDRVAIVSPQIREQLKTIPFFPLQRVEVIPNGIQTETEHPQEFDATVKRAELGLHEDNFVIGTVGRMFAEKNFEMQIRLIARLRCSYPHLKLVIVAKKYDYFKVLEELVTSLGVEDQVVFTGLRRDVPELLQIFDLFVMTSFSEGTSIALLEAMAAGLAVVVSDVGGNGDVVRHGHNGLLFNVHDFDDLSEKVATLIDDSFQRRRLASGAKNTAENYNFASMKNKYESFYKAVLSAHAN
ncbi:MAG: glycosyltransferase family 4 protein [Desulfurivibrionaceae bacterium]